MVEYSERS